MEFGKKKSGLKKYLLPIIIIPTICIAGLSGCQDSSTSTNASVNDAIDNQENEAVKKSLKIVETELPKIINDLEKYNQDIELLSGGVKWIKENLDGIRDLKNKLDGVIKLAQAVSWVVPQLDKMMEKSDIVQVEFEQIDTILSELDKLIDIQQEMNDSHQTINDLFEQYKQQKDMELLFQIEQQLNSNLINQIESLQEVTQETNTVFELSSNILITMNTIKSWIDSVKNTIPFLEEKEVDPKEVENIKKELAAMTEKIQKLPNKLEERSKSSISSIDIVQKEIQTLKVAQMVSGE